MTFTKNNNIIYINLDFKLNGTKYIAKYITNKTTTARINTNVILEDIKLPKIEPSNNALVKHR